MASDNSVVNQLLGVKQQVPQEVESTKITPAEGIALLAGGALGAYGLSRVPFAKYISRVANIEKKVPKESRITDTRIVEPQAIDDVDILKIALPTKQERGIETTESVSTKLIRQYLDKVNETKIASIQNPLTMGGEKDRRFGSALYDFVAQNPTNKPMPAEYWIKEFSNTQRISNFKSPNPTVKDVKMGVSREELADSNIANFKISLVGADAKGKGGKEIIELTGGFLKEAKDLKLLVSKTDLLDLVKNSPAPNIKFRRFAIDMDDEAIDLYKVADNLAKKIVQKKDSVLAQNPTMLAGTPNLDPIAKESYLSLGEVRNALTGLLAKLEYFKAKTPEPRFLNSRINEVFQEFSGITSILKKNKLNTNADMADIRNLELKLSGMKSQYKKIFEEDLVPRYANQNQYRYYGAEKFYEDVAYLPRVPFGKGPKAQSEYSRHYDNFQARPFNNQLYFVRYGQRTLEGGNNKKVFAIDEIQSDVQQKINKSGLEVRGQNTFGQEKKFAAEVFKLDVLADKMKKISDKGINMTEKDRIDFYKFREEFNELRDKTVNLSNIVNLSKKFVDDGKAPYMPFLDRSSWGDHAVKHVLKEAANKNMNWLAINPIERLHVAKRESTGTAMLGNLEFYGNSKGKATFDKGQLNAVLPKRLIDLAKQYNSEVKTIRISKSDPDKPFKVVLTEGETVPKSTRRISLGLGKDDFEHVGAFKTQDEALFASKEFDYGFKAKTEVIEMSKTDPRLYYDAFGIRITPEMKTAPFKLYKSEGGLVVNIFA